MKEYSSLLAKLLEVLLCAVVISHQFVDAPVLILTETLELLHEIYFGLVYFTLENVD